MTTIRIEQIITTADTQFRVGHLCEENIEAMMDLIERNVPFKTKMRLARWNDSLYLVDGFHRIEAYVRSKQMELSLDLFAIVDASSIEEIRVLAAGANVAHGKGNTESDFHYIIKRMMEFGDTYMEDTYFPDITKIAEAIGAARPKVVKGFSGYFVDGVSLSQLCTEKRNAAIVELSKKEGMSVRKIAEALGVSKSTVGDTLKKVSEIVESTKPDSQAAAIRTPQANTQDRPDTREEMSCWMDAKLSSLNVPLDNEYELADGEDLDDFDLPFEDGPKYDVLARTGFKADDARNKKKAAPSTDSEFTPAFDVAGLLSKRAYHLAEVAKIDALLATLSEGIEQAA